MTRNGKVQSYSVFSVSGDGKGGLGVGLGRDSMLPNAIEKSLKASSGAIEYFDLFEGRTLFHDITVKFKASKVELRCAPRDYGLRTHWAIQETCKVLGIRDLGGKVHGSTNALNVVKAFSIALKRQKTPEIVSRETGLRIVDVIKVFHGNEKENKFI